MMGDKDIWIWGYLDAQAKSEYLNISIPMLH
jgi:hypothetical protein